MSKFTQKGELPVAFENCVKKTQNQMFSVIDNQPEKGWKIDGVREGTSQTWMRVKSPDGLIFETRMRETINDLISKKYNIVNGVFDKPLKFDSKLKRLV